MARVRTITEDDQEALSDTGEHPLFPRAPGEKPLPADIAYIQITRIENGAQKWGPVIRAEDLQTEEQIFNMFGGGQYTLVARKMNLRRPDIPGGHLKNRHLTLAGKMKPLSGDPTPQELAFYNGQSPSQVGPPTPQANGLGDMGSLFAVMMKMSSDASERAQSAQQQFMQMFATMMASSKSDNQAMMQMVLQMTNASQTAMTGLVTAMMANKGGGPSEMSQYAELFKTLGFGKGDVKPEGDDTAESLPRMLENVADVVTGLAQLKGAAAPPAGAEGPSQGEPSAPGSAVDMLKKMGVGG